MQNNAAKLQQPMYASVSGRVTPDVTGMGLKDAVYLLENKGLLVEVQGRGKVQNQSLAAGTGFKKGQKISLLLN